MSDLISREEVLRAIITAGEIEPDLGYTHLHKVIENLPSAKASQNLAEPIKVLKGSDLIRREDAIEAVCRTRCRDKAKGCPAHSCPVIEEFDALPSAEPKTGEWVLDPNGMDWNIPAWRCSECGFVANYIGVEANGLGNNPMNWAGSKFCPQCGARMKGADDE